MAARFRTKGRDCPCTSSSTPSSSTPTPSSSRFHSACCCNLPANTFLATISGGTLPDGFYRFEDQPPSVVDLTGGVCNQRALWQMSHGTPGPPFVFPTPLASGVTFTLHGDSSGCWVTDLRWVFNEADLTYHDSGFDHNRYDLEVDTCDPFHAFVSTPLFDIEFTL